MLAKCDMLAIKPLGVMLEFAVFMITVKAFLLAWDLI